MKSSKPKPKKKRGTKKNSLRKPRRSKARASRSTEIPMLIVKLFGRAWSSLAATSFFSNLVIPKSKPLFKSRYLIFSGLFLTTLGWSLHLHENPNEIQNFKFFIVIWTICYTFRHFLYPNRETLGLNLMPSQEYSKSKNYFFVFGKFILNDLQARFQTLSEMAAIRSVPKKVVLMTVVVLSYTVFSFKNPDVELSFRTPVYMLIAWFLLSAQNFKDLFIPLTLACLLTLWSFWMRGSEQVGPHLVFLALLMVCFSIMYFLEFEGIRATNSSGFGPDDYRQLVGLAKSLTVFAVVLLATHRFIPKYPLFSSSAIEEDLIEEGATKNLELGKLAKTEKAKLLKGKNGFKGRGKGREKIGRPSDSSESILPENLAQEMENIWQDFAGSPSSQKGSSGQLSAGGQGSDSSRSGGLPSGQGSSKGIGQKQAQWQSGPQTGRPGINPKKLGDLISPNAKANVMKGLSQYLKSSPPLPSGSSTSAQSGGSQGPSGLSYPPRKSGSQGRESTRRDGSKRISGRADSASTNGNGGKREATQSGEKGWGQISQRQGNAWVKGKVGQRQGGPGSGFGKQANGYGKSGSSALNSGPFPANANASGYGGPVSSGKNSHGSNSNQPRQTHSGFGSEANSNTPRNTNALPGSSSWHAKSKAPESGPQALSQAGFNPAQAGGVNLDPKAIERALSRLQGGQAHSGSQDQTDLDTLAAHFNQSPQVGNKTSNVSPSTGSKKLGPALDFSKFKLTQKTADAIARLGADPNGDSKPRAPSFKPPNGRHGKGGSSLNSSSSQKLSRRNARQSTSQTINSSPVKNNKKSKKPSALKNTHETKKSDSPSDFDVSGDSFKNFLKAFDGIILALLALLLGSWLFKKFGAYKIPKNKKDQDAASRETRRRDLKRVKSSLKKAQEGELTKEAEVIKTYALLLESFEWMDFKRPDHLPPTHFLKRACEKFPMIKQDMEQITHTFCDTLYGASPPQENIAFNQFRASARNVVKYLGFVQKQSNAHSNAAQGYSDAV